ncbi:MAG: hemolysin family protein [Bdellovibrionota bacterium]
MGSNGYLFDLFVELILFLLFGLFTLASVAIIRSRSSKLRELVENRIFGSKLASKIIDKPRRYLLACQVITFLMVLFIGYYISRLTLSVADFFSLWIQSPDVEFVLGAALVFGIASFAAITSSQIGRAIAYTHPEVALCKCAPLIILVSSILSPVTYVLDGLLKDVIGFFELEMPKEREIVMSSEDLAELVEDSYEAGELEEDEREMIEGVVSFSETVVREIMTPRKDVGAISIEKKLREVLAVFAETGYSRLLVYGEDLDDVRGMLLLKDLIPNLEIAEESFLIEKFMRPVTILPNSRKLDSVLQELQRDKSHFAVVLDEHGGVDGVVTIEDLIEEIFGEIFDEHDLPGEGQEVRKLKNGDYLVDARILVDDLNEQIPHLIPEGEYDTIAGFVINMMGRIPDVGEICAWNGISIRIEHVEQNRITKLRIIERPKES